jgi:hypothetical protein
MTRFVAYIIAGIIIFVTFFMLAAFASPVQAGHVQANPVILTFRAACYDLDALIAVVEATQKSDQEFGDAWTAALKAKACFNGPFVRGAFERVADHMYWGGEGPIILIEVYDRDGQKVFTWYTEKFWRTQIQPV